MMTLTSNLDNECTICLIASLINEDVGHSGVTKIESIQGLVVTGSHHRSTRVGCSRLRPESNRVVLVQESSSDRCARTIPDDRGTLICVER